MTLETGLKWTIVDGPECAQAPDHFIFSDTQYPDGAIQAKDITITHDIYFFLVYSLLGHEGSKDQHNYNVYLGIYFSSLCSAPCINV